MLNNKILSSLVVASTAASLVCVFSSSAVAQQVPVQPRVLRNPRVSRVFRSDVSPALRDMAQRVSPAFGFHEAHPALIPRLAELQALEAQGGGPADGAMQSISLPLVSTIPGLDLLGVGNGFPNYSDSVAPPDTNAAVGDTQVVEWVNLSYAVFDKNTGAILAGPILGNALWSGFGGGCENDNDGDIIAQWDKIAHRWLLTQNDFGPNYGGPTYATCIAISTTPDATGSYYRYAFPQPGFPDYPKWGVMPDAYYQSQNNFGVGGAAYACAYERAKLLVGDTSALQICFQGNSNDDSLLPADLDSAGTLPPSGQQEVFVGSLDQTNSTLHEYLFHVDFVTPSNSTFTGIGASLPITVAPYSEACGGFSACIPQKGATDVLDSLGDRLMYRLAYRNFSDHQAWLVSHSVKAGNSTGMRWYEFYAPENSTNLAVFQQGTFAPDSTYRWMGSIAMDQSEDIALGYSESSSSMYPSIYYTGRVQMDPPGTMESEALVVAGTGSQVDTSDRWGDYSSMAIDEADDCTFWYAQEYYTVTASFSWSTRINSFKFDGCGNPPQPDFILTASPASQTVQAGSPTSYTATVAPMNSYTGSVTLSATGFPSGASGTFTINPITGGSGSSVLNVTTSTSTPAGTYPITITGMDGSLNHSASVILVVTPGAQLTFSPTSLNFGNQVINTRSSAKTVTVKSSGAAPVTFTSIATSGDYAISSNNCPGTLNPGNTCAVGVTFTPTKFGSDNGGLVFTDNAAGNPQTVPLSGTGIPAANLSPSSANFGNVAEGTPSSVHNFTLTNNSSSSITMGAITTGNPDYTETNTCDGSVAPKGHCTISVTLTPSLLGTDAGTLTVNDSASNSPQTASLTGKGIAQVTLSPSSMSFAPQKVGTQSGAKIATLTNNLPTALAVTISFTGADPGDYSKTDTCGGSVPAHSHCTISVSFKPTATGTRTATVDVADTANNSPQTISLTGTGK